LAQADRRRRCAPALLPACRAALSPAAMGCVKSKGSRKAEEPGEPLAKDADDAHERQTGAPTSLELPLGSGGRDEESPGPPPKTPMAPKDDSLVMFADGSHSQIETLVAGQAKPKSALAWRGSCFSSAEVSASSSRRGVAFSVAPGFVAVGLKSAPGKDMDSYGALDFAFYCMEHGRVQVFEAGEMKYTHKDKYSEESLLEIHLRAKPHIVEYLIDRNVVYQSSITPADSLHFQICFGDEKAVVTEACFVMKTDTGSEFVTEGAND